MQQQDTSYDFFVSYARSDNRDGWLSGFLAALQEEQRNFSGGREFSFFFDTSTIGSLDDWRHRIYEALAASRLLLAFISPAYFASEWCRREWQAWTDREIAKHILSEGAATVYIVEVPWLYEAMGEQQVAARLSTFADGTGAPPQPGPALELAAQISRRQQVCVQHFFDGGLDALRHEDLRRVLAELASDLDERACRIAAAETSPNTVPPYNKRFSGRLAELNLLRELLDDDGAGVITGIHGLGGVGKTELAFTYAHAFAGLYPGGRYLVPCEGYRSLKEAALALDGVFRDRITDEQRQRLNLHFEAIRDCLRSVAEEKGRLLLVLDNVTEHDLLAPDQTDSLCVARGKIHLLATTRLGPKSSGARGRVEWLTLDALPMDDAVALLEKHRPFADRTEHGAARQIARRLGGFTLAVELVAAWLAQNPEVTCAAFLDRLGLEEFELLEDLGEDPDIELRRKNDEHRLSAVLKPTLEGLSPPERTALEYAALLPPDQIVLPWLRKLVGFRYPEATAEPRPGHPAPWLRIVRKLFALALFVRSREDAASPNVVRCHRLVQDDVRRGIKDRLRAKSDVNAIVSSRALMIGESHVAAEAWELAALIVVLPHLAGGAGTDSLASDTAVRDKQRQNIGEGLVAFSFVCLADKANAYCGAAATLAMLRAARDLLQREAERDPANASCQRDLLQAQVKIGEVLGSQGDITRALSAYRAALDLTRRLAEQRPSGLLEQYSLILVHTGMGNLLARQGEAAKALAEHQAALDISRRLVERNPAISRHQRLLANLHRSIGAVLLTQLDMPRALAAYRAALDILRRLAEQEPDDVALLCDMAESHHKIGGAYEFQKNTASSLAAHRAAFDIYRRLAAQDPDNVELQRNMAASHARIGDVLMGQMDMPGALAAYQSALDIRCRLAEQDPANAVYQAELATCRTKIGDIQSERGDIEAASEAYLTALDIRRRLATQDPDNVQRRRSVAESAVRIGHLLSTFGEFRGALTSYRDALEIYCRLAELDPADAQKQGATAEIHMKIGRVLWKQEDSHAALAEYRTALSILRRLANQNPANPRYQLAQVSYLHTIGVALRNLGDIAQALATHQAALAIVRTLVEQDPTSTASQHSLVGSHGMIGRVLMAQGDIVGALASYRAALDICQRLAEQNPDDVWWQHRAADSHTTIGDALSKQGDTDAALAAYQAAFDIRSRLVEQDSDNANFQCELASICLRLAGAHRKRNDKRQADHYQDIYRQIDVRMRSRGLSLVSRNPREPDQGNGENSLVL